MAKTCNNILFVPMLFVLTAFGEACLCDDSGDNNEDNLDDVGDDDASDSDASTNDAGEPDSGCKDDSFCKFGEKQQFCDMQTGNCVNCLGAAYCEWLFPDRSKLHCNLVNHDCFECVCNQHCERGSGCIDGECAEGLDGGVNIDCVTGEEVEIKQHGVGGCPKGRPENVETSSECPPDSKSRFVAEGWSTLGRIQPPTECKNTIGNADYPPVNVYVSDFCININEITVGEYRQCVNAGACTEPEDLSSAFREHYYDWEVYDDFPMVNVEWVQADDYCKWIGGRLPTAAEWEKSARGPEKYVYPWGDEMPGDDLCDYANFGVSGRGCNGETCPVGLYPKGKSGYGVNDMMILFYPTLKIVMLIDGMI